MDDKGNLKFQPGKIADGLLAAHQAGAIDSGKLKELLGKATDADKAFADHAAALQRAGSDPLSRSKSVAAGLADQGAFAAAAIPAATAAAEAALPFAPATFGLAPIIAGGVAGLGAGFISQHVARAAAKEAAKHSEAIQSFADAAEAHPAYNQAGELAGLLIPGGIGAANLARITGIRAAEGGLGAALSTGGKELAAGALGGAAFETTIRPAFDYALKASGIGDPNQSVAPTGKSIAAAGLLGSLLPQLGIKFKGYDEGAMADIFSRAASGHELTPAEAEVYANASAKVQAIQANTGPGESLSDVLARLDAGTLEAQPSTGESTTARQALRNGQPIGAVTSEVAGTNAAAPTTPGIPGSTPPVIPGVPEPPQSGGPTPTAGPDAATPPEPQSTADPSPAAAPAPEPLIPGVDGETPAGASGGTSSPSIEPAKGSQAETVESPAGESAPKPQTGTATQADSGGKSTYETFAPEAKEGGGDAPVNPELGDTITTKEGQKLTVTGSNADTITAHPQGNPELAAHYSRAAIAAGLASGQSTLQKADGKTLPPTPSSATNLNPAAEPSPDSRGTEPAPPAASSADTTGQSTTPESGGRTPASSVSVGTSSTPATPTQTAPADKTENRSTPQTSEPSAPSTEARSSSTDSITNEPNTQAQPAPAPAQEEGQPQRNQDAAEHGPSRQSLPRGGEVDGGRPAEADSGGRPADVSGSIAGSKPTPASGVGYTPANAERDHQSAREANAPEIASQGIQFREVKPPAAGDTPQAVADREQSAPGAGIHYDRRSRTIVVDHDKMAGSGRAIESLGGNPTRWNKASLHEELIHDRQQVTEGPRFEHTYAGIWNSLSAETQAVFRRAYPDTSNAAVLGAEYERALIQRKDQKAGKGEGVTEGHYRKIDHLLSILAGPQPKAVEDHLAKMDALAPESQRQTPPDRQSAPSPSSPVPQAQGAEGQSGQREGAEDGSGSSAQETPATPFRQGDSAIYKGRAATVDEIEGGRATITLRPTPTMKSNVVHVGVGDLKPKPVRTFTLPDAPQGSADVIDHIINEGGIIGKGEAQKRAASKGLPLSADYDDLPNLSGIYQSKVFGGTEEPNVMAQTLHDSYGVGDGSTGAMYAAIDQAMRTRKSVRADSVKQAKLEQQSANFQRDAETPGKRKKEIHAGNLNVGDTVKVGDQTLKVIDVDPDSEDVTLEDHAKYGVQTVGPAGVLYVEQVRRAKGSSDFAPLEDGPASATNRPSKTATSPAPESKTSESPATPLPSVPQTEASREYKPVATSPEPTQPAPKVEKGSTQITLPAAEAKPFIDFANSIPDADIYKPETTGKPGGYGREDEPHITALFGLTGKAATNPKLTEPVAQRHGPITATLGKMSVFSNPDAPYDVLKISVTSPQLHALNKDLRSLEHQNDYPDYTPHLTIAYMKKGKAAKYAGNGLFDGKKITIPTLTHSSSERAADGGRIHTEIPLGKQAESAAARGHGNENTFIAVNKETGESVAEVSDRAAANINKAKYGLLRPSVYLPTLNEPNPKEAVKKLVADKPAPLPQLRTGEKGTADLFQGEDQPFNLMGETGTDGERITQAKAKAEKDAAEAKAKQDREQLDFTKPAAPKISDAASTALDKAFDGLFAANPQKEDQTETPAFKAWFEGSKAVDSRGAPLVVYHGAPDARFAKEDGIFKTLGEKYGRQEPDSRAFWFAADRSTAASYADDRRAFDYQNAEAGVIPTYLSLKNPLVVDGGGQHWRDAQRRGKTSDVIAEARAGGHDGAIIRNVADRYNEIARPATAKNRRAIQTTDTYVVFSSNQIKSATDNNGDFDPSNPSILRAANPANVPQEELPPDKIGPFVAAAQALIGSGIDTPEAMARVLDDKFQGKARKYSEALWDAFGMAKKALRASHDWTAIYSKLDSQGQPSTVNTLSGGVGSSLTGGGAATVQDASPPQPSSSNDRNRRPNLEPDRQDTGPGKRGSEDQLPVRSGATDKAGERVDASGEVRADGPASSPLSADVPSVPHREPGDSVVRESASATPQRAARDERPAGSRGADDSGLPSESAGSEKSSLDLDGPSAVAQTLAASGEDRLDAGTASGWHPVLTPEQVADGQFVERRLLEKGKPGVMLTNGTGTGKTFSGLGAIKRRIDAGENNILIVVPSDKIGSDWVKAAKEQFGIPDVAQLESTKDNGPEYRLVVTTFANMGQNPSLAQRPWGMVTVDEAQYLSSSQEGKSTAALDTFRALTFHRQGGLRRAEMMEPEATATLQRFAGMIRDGQKLSEPQLDEQHAAHDKIKAARAQFDKERTTRGEAGRPKALMLSATPFAYHFSLDYGEGYLFDHGPEPTNRGYNTPDARGQFYMDNFGYRMRTGKLTQPENATATGILERRFAEKLMKDGAMAGRSLQVPFDYSRQFVLTESQLGGKIDEVMKALEGDKELGALKPYLPVGDYLSRRYLLEALKARDSIPRIKEHLALGRKAVVFYDYNKGGATNPLRPMFTPGQKETISTPDGPQVVDLSAAYRKLAAKVQGFDDVVKQLDALESPIELFKREFPTAGIFNGKVSKIERRRIVDAFNKSGGEMNVMLVQRASGKEGISLQDRDGKHQRVLIDLGIPAKPTDAIQTEGRINRHGMQSNGIMEYLTTGTDFERWTFAQTIAQRASTAENLAMGERARSLLQSFASGYNDAEAFKPGANQGTGGKQQDAALENGDPYKNAVALYYTNAKKTARNKAQEGVDYFPTPEPLAFKMVEWAGIKPGESVLEPSAGHGAIARFFPDSVNKTGIEPSNELGSRLALNAPDINIRQQRFEDHHISNKYDAIVMNPPFGTAGRTAVDHIIKAAQHLREGGRIVALLPEGSATDKFNKWYDDAPGIYMSAEYGLPPVTFERAGTSVKARVVVLDKVAKPENAPQEQGRRDIGGDTITEFFDALANQSVPERGTPSTTAAPQPDAEVPSPSASPAGRPVAQPVSAGNQRGPLPNASGAGQSTGYPSPTSTIPTPSRDSNFSPADFLHTKSRTPVFVARPARRFSTDEFRENSARAKELRGHYSSFKGAGAIPGFHFKTAEARDQFIGTDGNTLRAANPARAAQTDTPEFKRWFKNSKAVDDEGKPIVFYHGTDAQFDTFGDNGSGEGEFFFTTSKKQAGEFGDTKVPAYLSLQNPRIVTTKFNPVEWMDGTDHEDIHKALAAGNDGVLVKGERGKTVGVAFRSNQIKSATKNNGQFDPESDNTLRAANPMQALKEVQEQIADEYASLDQKDQIKSGYDSANNTAEYRGEQAGNKIKLDIPDKADREAMPFVIEAGSVAANLQAMKTKIAASTDPKLAAKYGPMIDRAISDFPRLNKLRAGHDKMMADNIAELKAAGVDVGEVENYVTRKLDQPDAVKDTLPSPLFSMGGGQVGGARYFTKGRSFETLADAIKAGYPPKGTDLADLDRHRIVAAKRILEQRAFIERLRATPAPTDGKPIVGKFEQRQVLNGPPERTTPQGYTTVRTNSGEVPIHNQFAHLFKDLYGDSAARRLALFRAALKAAAFAKQYSLVFDTFHVGRLLYKMATGGGGSPVTFKNGKPQVNIRHGLALAEYDDADLGRAVAAGEISQTDADYARANRANLEELLANGLNVGRVADNLVQQAHAHVPGLQKVNDWIFSKLSRGAMIQTALAGFERNLKNFPERTRAENARQTAKEHNELFGNLQNQGLFSNKTFQDIARLIFLAPQWTESQFRYEGRAYGQIGRGIYDGFRGGGGGKPPTPPPGGWPGGVAPTPPPGGWPTGKRFRLGNSARAFAVGLTALLAANQVINYLSRGQSTFQNEEDDHKLDAFIPGGKRGFWFNPFEIAGEYAHAAFKYAAQHENPVDIASHVVSNKLSPIARGAKDILTGRDYSGKHYLDNGDRFTAGIVDALPSPIPLGGLLEKDPRRALGYRANRQPGSTEKQLLASVGLKTSNAQSPRSQMFALAQPFRADRGGNDAAGEYTELRRALDNADEGSSQSEIQWLLERGKSMAGIERAVGISRSTKPGGGISVRPEQFAGSADAERQFVASLTPEQSKVYQQAQTDHVENAQKLLRYTANLLRDDPDVRKLAAINAASDKARLDRNKAAHAPAPARPAPRETARPAPVFAGF